MISVNLEDKNIHFVVLAANVTVQDFFILSSDKSISIYSKNTYTLNYFTD
jgi:hypothetical protein